MGWKIGLYLIDALKMILLKKTGFFLQILPKLLFHLLSKSALFIFEMNQAKTFDNYSINS